MSTNLPAMSRAEKQVLKQFEAEISEGILDANRAAAKIGKALWDIRDEQLYRATHPTFVDYVEDRWQMSKSRAYRLITIAQEVAAHPELPTPKQWQLEPGKVAKRQPNLVPPVGQTPTPIVPSHVTEPVVVDAEWSEEVNPPAALPVASGGQQDEPAVEDSPGLSDTAGTGTTDGEDAKPSEVVEPGSTVGPAVSDGEAEGGETVPDQGAGGVTADVEVGISALVTLCKALEATHLSAMAAVITADQLRTVTGFVEALTVAYGVAHPGEALFNQLRRLQDAGAVLPDPAKAKRATRKAATPKLTVVQPESDAETGPKCDHPRASGHPARAKGKWLCGLCGAEVPVSAVSA